MLKGLKQESVRYYYVLIFFQWNEVYDYHVLYIVERCTWYLVLCSYLYSKCRHLVP